MNYFKICVVILIKIQQILLLLNWHCVYFDEMEMHWENIKNGRHCQSIYQYWNEQSMRLTVSMAFSFFRSSVYLYAVRYRLFTGVLIFVYFEIVTCLHIDAHANIDKHSVYIIKLLLLSKRSTSFILSLQFCSHNDMWNIHWADEKRINENSLRQV